MVVEFNEGLGSGEDGGPSEDFSQPPKIGFHPNAASGASDITSS